MIYLVGGAPRAGKSILGQRVAARLNLGWVATDVLRSLLKDEGPGGWDASSEAIAATAEWFRPYLERFIFGIGSLADHYLIEGVHFLPQQVAAWSTTYEIRAIFLGCSKFSSERFNDFPGRSRGYASAPAALKQQIVHDVPVWSEFIARQAAAFGCSYVDTGGDFDARLKEAELLLTA